MMSEKMWKGDPFANIELRLECSKALHRIAGKLGYSCTPKRSHIQRGAYFAEIDRHYGPCNIALGTGYTPMEAALDGYSKVIKDDPLFAAVRLECQVDLLRRALDDARNREARQAQIEAKLADTLDMLEKCRVDICVKLAMGHFSK